MKRGTIRYRVTVAIAMLPLLLLAACSEDETVAPPDFGSSPVTFIHANPGRAATGVAFFRSTGSDDVQVGTGLSTYRNNVVETVPNGTSRKYTVKAADGSTLKTATGKHDTTQTATVVYSGSATEDDLFVVATKKIKPGGDNAAVRFIHASKSATRRELRIGDENGAPIADIGYKEASNAYVTINAVSTTSLWVVDEFVDPKNNREFAINLTPGKSYSAILIGNDSALDANLKWDLLMIEDPE